MATRPSFDFCQAIRRLCEDITIRLPEFRHIDMDQVAVGFAQARRSVPYGLQAKLTPMRFENGTLVTRRGRHNWTIRRLFAGEQEILYILTFYLPRFQEQTFREKLITVCHELYHISADFNGDIRRLDGRYHVHSHSQTEYDKQMGEFVDKYLTLGPPAELCHFLKFNFRQLEQEYGAVVGLKIPIPKMLRIPDLRSA